MIKISAMFANYFFFIPVGSHRNCCVNLITSRKHALAHCQQEISCNHALCKSLSCAKASLWLGGHSIFFIVPGGVVVICLHIIR